MKKLVSIFLFFVATPLLSAQNTGNYHPLDTQNPVFFDGKHIFYQGKEIILGEKVFFVDGQLSDGEVAKYPYVFNSFGEAVKHLIDGTETGPMTLYLAPYVYWVDDPDDPTVRIPEKDERLPFGMSIQCEWLKIYGLTDNPQNVVLASNRGQTMGAEGNFTMFYFDGNGTSIENVTLGNYCNIDLEYPLNPKLNRTKRSSAVVQAQLAVCNGDKITARNSNFISRLNTRPLAGGKRTLFYKCHFECTDDALCEVGVHLDCSFTLFSSKPFAITRATGAVLLNCDFEVLTQHKQYLTKIGSPVTIVDSRFTHASDSLFIGWTPYPTSNMRSYQYHISLNGKPIYINADKPWLTVDMTGKRILDAYRFEYNGKITYNTYNLLQGDDEWDPMGIKERVKAAEKILGKSLSHIPTFLLITPSHEKIESGLNTANLKAEVKRFGNYNYDESIIQWSVAPEYQNYATLKIEKNNTCKVTGTNEEDETKTIVIKASTPDGLESASVLTVTPKYLQAPQFTSLPAIIPSSGKGKLVIDYALDWQGRKDQSLITWYRCTDIKGSNAVEVAVSRLDRPEQTYELSSADIGYYMMASVSPKHLRCHPGEAQTAITSSPVAKKDIFDKDFYTDFQNFPTTYQPEIIPGFWTVDVYKPIDIQTHDWKATPTNGWFYGFATDGARGTGLLQASKGARLLYTPVHGDYGNMSVSINVDPCKTAGQGFGSATGQYMDIYIKLDTQTLTGYALRIVRTTKFDRAVDFVLMKYENGTTTEICEPVSASCYRTDCTITLTVKGNQLTAHAETRTKLAEQSQPDLRTVVDLQAEIETNKFGGTGVQHTGSVGANATMLHWIKVEWE
ncbi:hypothetical protein EZS27_007150 [termite gut metagenome]|uniref:Uncharacterized protein n=1 Tax=termite gut metagenome TaxID=433724 RepID=A0A5J4SGF0_9ZZZZ